MLPSKHKPLPTIKSNENFYQKNKGNQAIFIET